MAKYDKKRWEGFAPDQWAKSQVSLSMGSYNTQTQLETVVELTGCWHAEHMVSNDALELS